MTVDFETLDYQMQLRRAGLRPAERLAHKIIALGAASVASLLELATEQDLLYGDPPICYGPIHALRLLGELGLTQIVEPLLRAFPMDDGTTDEGSASELWDNELPQILGRLGAAAIDQLWAFADDSANTHMARSAALTALAYATVAAPESREEIVAGLRRRLNMSEDPLLAGHLLSALGNIGAPDAYAEVMELYKAGRIDRDLVPPGVARQLLLSKNEKRLACVNHPLWERYDQHGPFPPMPSPR